MTKDEALKLALEALENIHNWLPTIGQKGLRDYEADAITAIKAALAQPKQEPVAWRNAAIRVGEDLCSVGPFGYYDMTAEQWLDWALSVVTVHASPPQRQPLTTEEITDLAADYRSQYKHGGTTFDEFDALGFARAIEAAHSIGDKT